jgi:hypothetical protein
LSPDCNFSLTNSKGWRYTIDRWVSRVPRQVKESVPPKPLPDRLPRMSTPKRRMLRARISRERHPLFNPVRWAMPTVPQLYCPVPVNDTRCTPRPVVLCNAVSIGFSPSLLRLEKARACWTGLVASPRARDRESQVLEHPLTRPVSSSPHVLPDILTPYPLRP